MNNDVKSTNRKSSYSSSTIKFLSDDDKNSFITFYKKYRNEWKFCDNKKSIWLFWVMILIVVLDIGSSIIISALVVFKFEETNLDNYKECFTANRQRLLSNLCDGVSGGSGRITRGVIYYSTIVYSILGLLANPRKIITWYRLDDFVLKSVFLARTLSLYVYLDFISKTNDNLELEYLSIYYSNSSTHYLLMGIVIVTLLLGIMMHNSGVFYDMRNNKTDKKAFIITWIGMGLLVSNLVIYINFVNMVNLPFYAFLEPRGPGLQEITFLNYAVILLSYLEYLIVTLFKHAIRDDTKEDQSNSSELGKDLRNDNL